MARNPYRRYEVTEYQKEALKFLQPPEDITVSEWADKYRVLDAKTSAMPGPWRTEHTPYLKGIMDEFNNYETEEIVYVKAYAGRWNRVPPEHGRLHRPTGPCADHDRISDRYARKIHIGEQTAADVQSGTGTPKEV